MPRRSRSTEHFNYLALPLPLLLPKLRDSLLTISLMVLEVLPFIPFLIFESAFPRLSLAFTYQSNKQFRDISLLENQTLSGGIEI
jgi:hypothetical protein